MNRTEQLKRKARTWRFIGALAFLIGAFMLYQKVYYETRDFYGESFEVYHSSMTSDSLTAEGLDAMDSAMELMIAEDYWAATTELEALKASDPEATQIAEWYKILCMIGVDEKEEAIELLEYYVEQPGFDFKKAQAQSLLKEY